MSNKTRIIFLSPLIVLLVVIGAVLFLSNKKTLPETKTVHTSSKSKKEILSHSFETQESASSVSTGSSDPELPDSKQSDWDLVLINREHRKPEMNPPLAMVAGLPIDARIAGNVRDLLKAAQKIDPKEHLISGYRSVSYQSQLYNQYIKNEMKANPSLTREEAMAKVDTYSQPPEASEHETGLAIDMSDVNELNEAPANVVSKIATIAPDYGFILRFTADGQYSTGVDYEDWHWRYVGVDNAKYMVAHHLTLEQYLQQLPS